LVLGRDELFGDPAERRLAVVEQVEEGELEAGALWEGGLSVALDDANRETREAWV
jgi:hypothetical protein